MNYSSELAGALVASLDDPALDALADLLAPKLEQRLKPATEADDGWLDAKRAAAYLGLSVNALHKLTAERAIPFEQEGSGCKLWLKRSHLDEWREAGGSRSRSCHPG
jgi:hypothetical protein